jgi:hypothetical protein
LLLVLGARYHKKMERYYEKKKNWEQKHETQQMGIHGGEIEEDEKSYNESIAAEDGNEGNKQNKLTMKKNQRKIHILDTNSIDYKLFSMLDPPQISYNIINVDEMADVKIASYETSNTIDLSLDHNTSGTNEDVTLFDLVHYGANPCQI